MNLSSYFFLLFIWFSGEMHAQKNQAFYLLSQETQHLDETLYEEQLVSLKKEDEVINQVGVIKDSLLTLNQSGTYRVSGYICVNPGVYGKKVTDYISIRMVLRYSTDQFKTSTLISSQTQNFLYGNLSVSEQIQTPERILYIPKGAQIAWFVQQLNHSTVSMNSSKRYQHIDPPTGLLHSKALYIVKTD